MRNFSSQIDQFCTYVLDDSISFTDPLFVRACEGLIITMGANPEMMTPSEERVLADFMDWISKQKMCDQNGTLPSQPVFVYHNLNEGHSVAIVWTDGKNKLLAPANQTMPGSHMLAARDERAVNRMVEMMRDVHVKLARAERVIPALFRRSN